jgi:hypothetical protein
MRTIRDLALILVLSAAVFVYERRHRAPASDPGSDPHDSRNVILVVSDGMRWQEVFRGADSLLLFGHPRGLGGNAADVRRRFWRSNLAERKKALMPFLWGTVAHEGTLLGNHDLGSRVVVTNPFKFSYPGYNELLTGRPDGRIDRNDYGPNPNVTVFEWLNRRPEFRGRVAAVGAWDAFADIFNRRRSGIQVHASRSEPLDRRTHATAMRILQQQRPRALFVAYVETDDWAHQGRYDRTLEAAHAVDAYLAALWSAVQSHPNYRDRTTLVFTADHGRGRTPRDWMHHGRDVPGAEEVFIAMIGPGAPALGEQRSAGTATQAQVAATVAAAVGLDFRRAMSAAPPIGGPARKRATSPVARGRS